jgi:hypothetical protein
MSTRILGPTGSKRRKRMLLGPILLTAALAALFIAGAARAVHDADFQLDGDTTSVAYNLPGGVAPAYDWDDLFNANGSTTSLVDPAGGNASFTNASFKRDFGVKVSATDACSITNVTSTTFCTADPTTYATGSKDTLDIPGWQCNKDNNVNSKIDIMNAYAAAYTASNGDKIMYFGMEKNKENGSNNVGFWFLQGNADCSSPSGGSVTWSGQHTVGDVLVVSEFSNGGGVSTVIAYKWVGGANPLVPFGQGGDCKTAPIGLTDSLCATTNATGTSAWNQNVTTKWLTANGTSVGHTVVPPNFFEGGINLTKVFTASGGTAPRCFNTFIGDTRSSTSLTATLFDYTRGQLGQCSVSMTTTPSQTTRVLGSTDAVTDTADIVGSASGGGTAPTPTGTVSFFLCAPSELTPANTGTCQGTSGTAVTGNPVTATEKVAGTATATSGDAHSLISGVGKYCFRATFTAAATDTNYPGATAETSNLAAECFTVTDTSSIVTDQKWLPNDSATVTTGGSAVSGTVTFTLYEDADCGVTAPTAVKATFTDSTPADGFTTSNASVYTATQTISWKATFVSDNGVGGSTSSCETSTVTINNNH